MQFGSLQRTIRLADGKLGWYKLGQSISGDWREFVRRQATQERRPTFAVFCEAFGDISDDCKSVTCGSDVEDTLHQPNYGRGNIVLQNKSANYTEAGRSLIETGYKGRIWAGVNGNNIPIWTGQVTDAKINSRSHNITLSLAQPGETLNNKRTSGDYSSYNTPKTLIDYLCGQAGLAAPSYDSEGGPPATYEFGNTYIENSRTYWSLIHGAGLCIFYVPIFDVYGVLNMKRRSGFTDVDYLFDDSNIISIEYVDDAELINNKVIDYGNPIRFEFTFADNINFGQQSRSKTNAYSIARWGERSDYETDELVGTWTKASAIIDEILDFYPYQRSLYRVVAAAVPQLELMDRVRVDSAKRNIQGRFVVMGRKHTIRPGSYVTEDILMSMGAKF